MFQNMTLKTKLLISFLLVGVLPFLVIAGYSLLQTNRTISTQIKNAFEGIAQQKKAQIELLFSKRKEHLNLLVETMGTLRKVAFEEFEGLHDNKKIELETYYKRMLDDLSVMAQNRLTIAAVGKIAEAFSLEGKKTGGEKWQAAVASYGSSFEAYIKTLTRYNDLLLVDKDGNVVYAVDRTSALGQNLVNGDLKNTTIGICYQRSLNNNRPVLSDIALYGPRNNAPAYFMGVQIKNGNEPAGTLLFEVSVNVLISSFSERKGLGKTGEMFLVGPDKLMRSNSFLDAQNRSLVASLSGTVEKNGMDTEAVREALAGKSGARVLKDYRDTNVFAVYAPLKVNDLNWALILEMDMEEVFVPQTHDGQDFMAQYKEVYGYYDLALFTPDGYCFYTVAKEADWKTNLLTGKYRNSNHGKLLQNVLRTRQMAMADYELYAASNNKASSFIAAPLIIDGKIEMIISLQLDLGRVNAIMQERTGMGKTGETYLVGSDKLMRSDSFLDPTNRSVQASLANPAKGSVDTEQARKALAGETGFIYGKDYMDHHIISAYMPVQFFGVTWALLAEIDQEEAFESMTQLEWVIGVIFVLGVLGIVVFSLFLANSISTPISKVVGDLHSASEQVASASTQMSKATQEISEGASEQASTLEEISSSMEEMTSMTRQNADNANEAEKLAKSAKKSADDGNVHMKTLNESMAVIGASAQEMEKIIKNIEEIAFQTNMLALNAAVEAARAGEHGRGFAVVAEEVRNLARKAGEFAKSTGALVVETTDQIKDSAEISKKSVESFSSILDGASKVSELVAEVSAATQEQARGLNQVTLSVTDMDKVVQANAANAEEGASISEELNSQAISLRNMVEALSEIIGMKMEESSAGRKNGKKFISKVKDSLVNKTFQPKKEIAPLQERKVQKEKLPIKPEEVIPLNEDEFKDF